MTAIGLAALGLLACGEGEATRAEFGQGVEVTVEPRLVETVPGGTLSFAAAVTGSANVAVTWTVLDAGGGTVDGGGRYTAPAVNGIFNIVATSLADPTKSGVATAVVAPPSSTDTTGLLDPSRRTTWNPGLNAVGGIPARGTVFRTISPSGDTSGATDPAAINAALAACPANQVVALTAGDFYVNTLISVLRSNVTLRGAVDANGRPATVIHKTPGMASAAVHVGRRWSGDKFLLNGGNVNLATDGVKGSNAVTLVSVPAGLAAGELVLIDQLVDYAVSWWPSNEPDGSAPRGYNHRYNRPIGQVLEVASVVGNVVTFTTPLHITFATAQSAQLCRYGEGGTLYQATKWSGVENIKVTNETSYVSRAGGNFKIEHSAYCWLKNIESAYSWDHGVELLGTFRSVLRDSYLHHAWPVNGGAGYNLTFSWCSADNLVENNISWNADKVMVMYASGGGNVIGYNYMEDGWIHDGSHENFVESGLNASHGTTPHMELFEGNQAFRFDSDETHGNTISITVFRNHLTGRRRRIEPLILPDANPIVMMTSAHSWWFNFVGNVLGTPGMTVGPVQTSWIYDSYGATTGNGSIGKFWVLGSWASQSGLVPNAWTTFNQAAVDTTIRHGNFNFGVGTVPAGIVWDPNIAVRTLPNSLYLSAKPPFFGQNQPWPWVTPENASGPIGTLPARERFDSML